MSLDAEPKTLVVGADVDEHQSIHISIPPPILSQLNRYLALQTEVKQHIAKNEYVTEQKAELAFIQKQLIPFFKNQQAPFVYRFASGETLRFFQKPNRRTAASVTAVEEDDTLELQETKPLSLSLSTVVEGAVLSDKAILRHMQEGSVVISPFDIDNLSTSSYDVTLGEYFYEEQAPQSGHLAVYNPYSEKMVERVWGTTALRAQRAGDWMKETGCTLENINPEDKIIWLPPGKTILAHTAEYIGGVDKITTMMKARSSMGRNFVSVCKVSHTAHF